MSPLDRAAVVSAYRDHVNRGLATVAELTGMPVERSGRGAHVVDEHGERYLQCGGYGVYLLGLCHPRVVAAVRRQLESMPLGSRELLSEETAAAAAAIARVAPDGLDYVHLATSGADATETAVKLARLRGCTRIVSMERGYHGKSVGALSVTGHARYREPFEPLLGGVTFVPFGDEAALARELERDGEATCVILEPVQGEGGVRIPPPGYLAAVERRCRAAGAFLVVDEIMTGLGRTGRWWASGAEGVTPDVLLAGKTLSGGVVPVSAVVASSAAFGALNRDPVLHSGTFSGAPLAAVAARAAVEAIERDGIVERARALGERLLGGLADALGDCDAVAEVRGSGLLIGVEFAEPGAAGEFILEMLARRVLVSHSSSAHEVVRFTPPAVLDDADVDWALDAAAAAGRAVGARHRSPTPSGRA